ncbi:hypothetical protein Pcinc_024511 [Petrolisthes cinctipes]|uniref:protein-histidine N-methyltransferase n=1 Tax=Petrolisthes cinctipes TaxID=88211 RepID=A0AAE1KDF9_PETCI|nr:hypothetical protein Pcinc_024511 [Petrolisthes cinctipes]
MFQFNFKVNTDGVNEPPVQPNETKTDTTSHQWLPAEQHKINTTHLTVLNAGTAAVVEDVTVGQTKIHYVNMKSAAEQVQQGGTSDVVSCAFLEHSDLVPAVYEGGLKIWECTWDLLQFLATSDLTFDGKRVLELGCGAALPALYCAKQGSHITLQDYNREVIEKVTIPNVVLNLCGDHGESACLAPDVSSHLMAGLASRASFFSGDWGNLSEVFLSGCDKNNLPEETRNACQDEKFDLILTSETIYNPECHLKLLHLLTSCLKENGLILLAAKAHYFGVGGGTCQFVDLMKQQGNLAVQSVITNSDGLKREILKIEFKK